MAKTPRGVAETAAKERFRTKAPMRENSSTDGHGADGQATSAAGSNPAPPLLKAVTIGQVSGLKMNKQDGSWDITVTVERERVPNSIEKWGYQTVAVAVMKDAKEAEKALEDDIFGNVR